MGEADLEVLPRTDRECHLCEDGVFIRDGYELVCSHCQHSPTADSGGLSVESGWERHRRQVADADERPRLYGGYKDAYWGNGEYSVVPSEGFVL